MWTSKAYAHSTDESARDECEEGDKRTLLAKRLAKATSVKRNSCKGAPYRSKVAVITPTNRKSRRIMMKASFTASKKV